MPPGAPGFLDGIAGGEGSDASYGRGQPRDEEVPLCPGRWLVSDLISS